jgi:hypothetical protein
LIGERFLGDAEAVHGHLRRICFKTGPPGRVGAELEWLVARREDPRTAMTKRSPRNRELRPVSPYAVPLVERTESMSGTPLTRTGVSPAATTSGGSDGRPRPDRDRSANISAGLSRPATGPRTHSWRTALRPEGGAGLLSCGSNRCFRSPPGGGGCGSETGRARGLAALSTPQPRARRNLSTPFF